MEILLDPEDIRVDNARNTSRAGLAHAPEDVRDMADRLLALGQLDAIEVVAPEGWDPEEWALCVTEHGVGVVECGEHVDRDCAPGRVNYGYRRHAAALLLKQTGETSARWDGKIRARVAPAGLTAEDLEDRNLAENLAGMGLPPIDLGLAAHRLTADPKDGGRGEEPKIAAARLRVTVPELQRLAELPGLCAEGRALNRLNHRNPEIGITGRQALKLARRPVEVQAAIIAEAKDARGTVTPKATRAAIAPHQGRQGQPPGMTGAQLTRLADRFNRIARSEHDQQRAEIEADAAALVRDVLLAVVALDPAALAKLPGNLARVVEAVVTREPERP